MAPYIGQLPMPEDYRLQELSSLTRDFSASYLRAINWKGLLMENQSNSNIQTHLEPMCKLYSKGMNACSLYKNTWAVEVLSIPLCSECVFIQGGEEMSVECCGNGRGVISFIRSRENHSWRS